MLTTMGASVSPRTVGRYAIHDKIAQGGMASVHFGRLQGAAGFSRTVAIKRLHSHLAEEPEFLSTMIDEARLAARIHHPNVVPTLDVVAEAGELLIVMEYVRGESLGRLIGAEVKRKRRVPLPIASAVVVGALHGLHAAHEATSDHGTPLEIVHRDVSPQNILVGVDGVPRVIDFGVAKATGRLQTTREGVLKGKLSYMAPEQIEGFQATRRVDIYAMAVVLWEILTGRRLFKAETDAGVIGLALAGAKDPPSKHAPNLPEDLDALVMKGLARDPAERFATAREMAESLMKLVPPAFPTEVGAWVEELARETLAQRRAILAEIESRSGMITSPQPAAPSDAGMPVAASDSRPVVADDELPTVASQPSSMSVEAPVESQPAARKPRRPVLVAALSALVLLGAVMWWGVTRSHGASHDSTRAASASETPATSAAAASSTVPSASSDLVQAQPPPSPSTDGVAASAPSPSTSTSPSPPAARPSGLLSTARAGQTAKPPTHKTAPGVRFTNPD